MSKTSNNQKLHVLKLWLQELKSKNPGNKKKTIRYNVDDEE